MINITEGIDTRLFNKGNYMKFELKIAVIVALISASTAAFAQVVDDADVPTASRTLWSTVARL